MTTLALVAVSSVAVTSIAFNFLLVFVIRRIEDANCDRMQCKGDEIADLRWQVRELESKLSR